MIVGSVFSGIGLLDYGLHLAGFDHAWLCEVDEFRRGILHQRFPDALVYPDVRAVGAGAPRVDLVAGGFPCKGASSAGKRDGFGHPETVLWFEMLRVVRELRPRYVLVENVADLLTLHRGEVFGEVVGGLAALGYDVEWDCFPAAAFGAPHRRDRVLITAVAHSERVDGELRGEPGDVPGEARTVEGEGDQRERRRLAARDSREALADATGQGWPGGREPEHSELQRLRGESPQISDPAPDAAGERRSPLPDQVGERRSRSRPGADRGRPVAWGDYAPAIAAWELLLGRRAPEPLVCGVDDGSTRRVERSRLSALGDGVLVQAGWLCGQRIMTHATETRPMLVEVPQ